MPIEYCSKRLEAKWTSNGIRDFWIRHGAWGEQDKDVIRTRVISLRGKVQELEVWTGTGGHGGGDDVMLTEVFGVAEPDKYKRAADERSGLYSILIGASANKSFESGSAVKIAELVNGLTSPNAAPMPTRDQPVPMPKA